MSKKKENLGNTVYVRVYNSENSVYWDNTYKTVVPIYPFWTMKHHTGIGKVAHGVLTEADYKRVMQYDLPIYLKEEHYKELEEKRMKSIEDAKNLLKENGYFTDQMWHVSDVRDKMKDDDVPTKKLTDEECMELIKGTAFSEYMVGEINSSIVDGIENF